MSAGANAGAARACGPCLARTWLIARLAGAIEIARHQRRRLREILALSEEKLVAGLGGARAGAIADEFERLDIDALREAVARSGLEAACRHDPAYPARLRDLDDAPATLFVAGGVSRLEGLVGADLEQGPRAVAVVGTRRASADGLEVARALGRGLAAAGVTVVSGMALGVDSAAHAGALESSGRTVAVLAGGADVPYPPSKARLHGLIAERGCVVGELPPGFVAMRWCFPARNRIIAALGHMTIVVEAARRSGSLITAEIAIDIGREVGAVPGPGHGVARRRGPTRCCATAPPSSATPPTRSTSPWASIATTRRCCISSRGCARCWARSPTGATRSPRWRAYPRRSGRRWRP